MPYPALPYQTLWRGSDNLSFGKASDPKDVLVHFLTQFKQMGPLSRPNGKIKHRKFL